MEFEERNVLENKEALVEKKKLVREVIGFLNYREGGVICLGVNDDEQVVGIDDYDDAQLKIKNWIRDLIRPSCLEFVDIVLEEIDGKHILKINIKSGPRKPYYLASKGRIPDGCFARTASGVEPMDEDMIEHTLENSYPQKRLLLKEIKTPY